MTRDEIERFVRRRETAWNNHDLLALTSDHTEDCVIESPTHGSLTTPGRIREVYATWFDAFPDLVVSYDDLVVEGDRAVVFFTTKGTHIKPFASIPPSGRRVEIRGALLFWLKEGRIVREKRLYDATSLMLQIGALKARV